MRIQQSFLTYFYDDVQGIDGKILLAIKLPSIPAVGTFIRLENSTDTCVIERVIMIETAGELIARCIMRKMR